MAIQKILRVEKPAKDDRSYRGGMFIIWYENPKGTEYSKYIHKLEYDRLMFEQELLSRSITIVDIEKYKQLIMMEIQDEEAFEGNCI